VCRDRLGDGGVRVELKGDVRGRRKSKGPLAERGGGSPERSVDLDTFKQRTTVGRVRIAVRETTDCDGTTTGGETRDIRVGINIIQLWRGGKDFGRRALGEVRAGIIPGKRTRGGRGGVYPQRRYFNAVR